MGTASVTIGRDVLGGRSERCRGGLAVCLKIYVGSRSDIACDLNTGRPVCDIKSSDIANDEMI